MEELKREDSKNTIFIDTDNIKLQEKKLLSDYTRNFTHKVGEYSKNILENYNSSNEWDKYLSFENNYYLDFLEYEIWNSLKSINKNTSKNDIILIYSRIEEKIWGFLKKYLKINWFFLWNNIKKNMLDSLPYDSNNNFINFFKNEFSQELFKVIKKLIDIDINIPIIDNDYVLPNITNNGILIAYLEKEKIKFKYEYNKATEESSLINSTINKEILESDKKILRSKIAKLNNAKSDILNIIDYLKISKNEIFVSIFDKDILDMINNITKIFDDFDFELKYYKKNFYLNYFRNLIYYIMSHELNWTLHEFNEGFIKEKWVQLDDIFYRTLKGNINQIFNKIAKDIEKKRYINKEENTEKIILKEEKIILKEENTEKIILKKEDLINLKKMINSFIKSIIINSDMTITQLKEQNIFISFDEMVISLNINNKIFNKNIYLSYFKNLLEFYANNKKLTLYDYNLIYQDKLEEIIYNFPKYYNRNEHYIILKSVSEQFENKTIFNSDLLSFLEDEIDKEILKLDNIID